MGMRASPCGTYGDLNNDGTVTDADVELLNQYVRDVPFSEINTPLTEAEFLRRSNVSNGGGSSVDTNVLLDFLQWRTDSFPICNPTGKANITFISSPTGANVSVQKPEGTFQSVGLTNITTELVAGSYRVRFSRSGYSTSYFQIVVVAGEEKTYIRELVSIELADFKVGSIILQKTIVKPGERVLVSTEIKNYGSREKSGLLKIYIDAVRLSTVMINRLAELEELLINTGLDIPTGISLGMHYLKFEAIPDNQSATDTKIKDIAIGYETTEHDVTFVYPDGATLTVD